MTPVGLLPLDPARLRVGGHSTVAVCEEFFSLARRVVEIGGSVVPLTPIECRILTLLVDARGRPVSRSAIVHHLTGSSFVGRSRTADDHVKNLRKKLEDANQSAGRVVTVRNEGYAFRIQGA